MRVSVKMDNQHILADGEKLVDEIGYNACNLYGEPLKINFGGNEENAINLNIILNISKLRLWH